MTSVPFATYQVEFRLENLSTSSSTRIVWGLGGAPWDDTKCEIPANTLELYCKQANDATPGGIPGADLAGRTNARIRYSRNHVTEEGRVDVWDGDCTGHDEDIKNITGGTTQTFTGNFAIGQSVTLAFFRLGTTISTDPTACPLDAPVATASLVDYRFEGDSLADASGNGYTLSGSGYSWANSETYAPTVTMSGWTSYLPVFRQAAAFELSGEESVVFTNGTGIPVSYAWEKVSGPGTLTFSPSAADSSPSVTASVSGEYVVRLTVEDDDAVTDSVDTTIGIVDADSNGKITITGDMGIVLGNVTMHGTAPWPWYDVAEVAVADKLKTSYATDPAVVLQSGTLSITADAPNGTEGDAITGVWVVGNGTNFTQDLVGAFIYIHFDVDGDGTYNGRSLEYVSEVLSTTLLRINSYYYSLPLINNTTMPWSLDNSSAVNGYNTASYNNTWNFYEALLGMYRLYYRTNLATYRDTARSFCTRWWKFGLAHGYKVGYPMHSGWQSMIACAVDGQAVDWDQLAYNIGHGQRTLTSDVEPPEQWADWDVREDSYRLRAASLMARIYPAHAADPTTTRATWCGYVGSQIEHYWQPTLTATGFWPENVYYWNSNSPGAPINGVYGTSPWRSSGLGTLALEYAYGALNDVNACNNPALASSLLTTITSAAQFLWDYGRSPDGGLYAQILYNTKFYNGDPGVKLPSDMPSGSTVSMTNGSTAVTGNGTNFLTMFAPCDGTTWIGISASAHPWVENGVHRVASCEDNTHLTLVSAYPYTSETVTNYAKTVTADSTCSPSIASYCEEDLWSGRSLSADAAAGAAWLYAKTALTAWKDRAEYYAGKTYGGCAEGPGCTGDSVGPNADGGVNNLADILDTCATTAIPCGAGYLASMRGKQFGMSAGAGDVPVMLYEIAGAAEEEYPPTLAPRIKGKIVIRRPAAFRF
jgi:hypothetical protein